MPGIVLKHREAPDIVMDFTHGRAIGFQVDDDTMWRSELTAGWNWDEDLKPWAGDATSCPYTHREVVLEGRIRYLMTDGSDITAGPGDVLLIKPGHRAWVVGDETCILIDW